jgi:THH1/TOM1/TOM3 domain
MRRRQQRRSRRRKRKRQRQASKKTNSSYHFPEQEEEQHVVVGNNNDSDNDDDADRLLQEDSDDDHVVEFVSPYLTSESDVDSYSSSESSSSSESWSNDDIDVLARQSSRRRIQRRREHQRRIEERQHHHRQHRHRGRDRSGLGASRAKVVFHVFIAVAMLFRSTFFFMAPAMFEGGSLSTWPLGVIVLWNIAAAELFCAAYCMLLMSWAEFYYVYARRRRLSTEYRWRMNAAMVCFCVVLLGCTAVFGLMIFAWAAGDETRLGVVDSAGAIFVSVLLLLVAAGFVIYGALLARRLREMRARAPVSVRSVRDAQTIRLGLVAGFTTLCFIGRSTISIYSVIAASTSSAPVSANDSRNFSVSLWLVWFFYFAFELLPTALMLVLMRKMPGGSVSGDSSASVSLLAADDNGDIDADADGEHLPLTTTRSRSLSGKRHVLSQPTSVFTPILNTDGAITGQHYFAVTTSTVPDFRGGGGGGKRRVPSTSTHDHLATTGDSETGESAEEERQRNAAEREQQRQQQRRRPHASAWRNVAADNSNATTAATHRSAAQAALTSFTPRLYMPVFGLMASVAADDASSSPATRSDGDDDDSDSDPESDSDVHEVIYSEFDSEF